MLARRVEDAVKEDDKVKIYIFNLYTKSHKKIKISNIAEQAEAREQGPPGGGTDSGRGREAHTVRLQVRWLFEKNI